MSRTNKKTYPKTLKSFPEGPVLKKDGKPFKYGTIIPLVGGVSLGCSLATQKKPDFLLTYTPFLGNEKHLVDYWPDVPYYNLDEFQSEESTRNLDEIEHHFKDVDFVSAVPPCAGLSQLNASVNRSNMSRGSDAVQNEWIYKTTKFVLEYIKPKVLWGENAPGLFTNIGEGVVKKLEDFAEKYGYSFSMIKTNSLLHGLPQKRERTYYFFWDSEFAPLLNYYNKKAPILKDYFAEIPKNSKHIKDRVVNDLFEEWLSYKFILEEVEKKSHEEFIAENYGTTLMKYIYEHKLQDRAKEYIKKINPNHREFRIFKHIENKKSMNKGWWDASPHFFYTHFNALVSRNMWCGIHPVEKRYFSSREMIWLMGHPHDFNLLKNEKGKYDINVIAQNAPVPTTRDWCFEVMKFINGDLPLSCKKSLRQNNKKPIEVYTAKGLF